MIYVVSNLLSKSSHAYASTVHNYGFSIDEGLVEVLTLALAVTCHVWFRKFGVTIQKGCHKATWLTAL